MKQIISVKDYIYFGSGTDPEPQSKKLPPIKGEEK
jgi:hypothetical protein